MKFNLTTTTATKTTKVQSHAAKSPATSTVVSVRACGGGPQRPRRRQRSSLIIYALLSSALLLIAAYGSASGGLTSASLVDSSNLKPSVILILPQSLTVPIKISADDVRQSLPQYVALVNNIQNERDDQILRQRYKKLTLQVRDAKSPITGQLFFEHVFDYFSRDQQHLLIPINLEQVSTTVNSEGRNYARNPQHLIVSVRPYQLDAGFGSDSIEFTSSVPVPVESIASGDGRRSFAIVQTDKPIYKPEDKVRIRSLVVNENFRPVLRDELKIQIKNPHKVVVEEIRFPNNESLSINTKGGQIFSDYAFEFPPEPMLGTWTLHLLHSDPIANDTTSFEVREYVLPTYEIQFEAPKYILPNTEMIPVAIIAKYHHGKPVQGKAHFKFGYRESSTARTEYVGRSSIKDVDPKTGRVDYKVNVQKFKDHKTLSGEKAWFPTLAGWSFVIEATVTEMSTGHREISLDSSSTFIRMPYVISFEDSIEHFKPGLRQQLSVQVVEIQTRQLAPAGARIVAQFTDQNGTTLSATDFDLEAYTDEFGRAAFNFGPLRDDIISIQATLRWINSTVADTIITVDQGDAVELAVGEHSLLKHESINGWISLANKTITQLKVGDQFISDLLIRDAVVIPKKIFYTITSRGQILSLSPLNPYGFVSFTITEDMVPSIRIVLFALTLDSVGLLSDSMRINIDQTLDCGLSLQYKSLKQHQNQQQPTATTTYKPGDKGELIISGARQGDFVSIMGVDAAVYTLNNRTRLDSTRITQRVKKLDPGCGFGGGKNNLDVFHNAGLMFFKDVTNQELTSRVGSSCMPIAGILKNVRDMQLGYSRPVFSAAISSIETRTTTTLDSGRQRGVLGRPKREVDIDATLDRYKDPMDKMCCRLGTFEDSPQRRNCSVRARIVAKYMHQEDNRCSHIYFDCCRAIFGEPILLSSVVSPRDSQEPPVSVHIINRVHNSPQHTEPVSVGHLDLIESQTLVRKDFRETWLFDIVEVDQPNGSASLDVKLPHSITGWSVSALALNTQHPMCFMPQPLKLITFQDIFLQVSMPYKIIQGEQIDLIATIFNYSPQKREVLLYIYGVEDVCSEAEPGERSDRKRIMVDKHSSLSVLFPMIPLKIGKYPIKILAITSDGSDSSDIVERQLKVVPRGKQMTDETTFSLDPLNQQRRSKRAIRTGNLVDEIDSSRGVQRSRIRLTPSRDSEYIVPQTQECIVSAIGDKMGQIIQTTMLDVDNLIRLPHGCGEQVMIYLGPTLYTAKYLSSVNKLSGDLRWRAIRYIQSGYKRILNYRKKDGSFSAFARREPSIWLTAFIAKMLCQTERTAFIADEVHVDKTVVNSALNWLVDKQDVEAGYWIEKNPVYHREMLGGIVKENALTSFVVLTLNECSHHATELVADEQQQQQQANSGMDKLKLSLERAESMLMLNYHRAITEKNVYVLALTAYALSVSRPKEAALIMDAMMPLAERSESRNQLYWYGDYQVETAAYALLAIIELGPFVMATQSSGGSKWRPVADAAAISNWLASRRSYTGAFESTQDTIVALEALSRYAQIQSAPNSGHPLSTQASSLSGSLSSPSLTCNVTVNNHTKRSIEFNQQNAQILQTFKLGSLDIDPSNGEILDILTSGNGLGTMSVKLKYNMFHEEDKLCRFDISTKIEEWQPKIVIHKQQHHKQPSSSNINEEAPIKETNDAGDYLKMFDKSMLSELNLVDQGDLQPPVQQQPPLPPPAPQQLQRRVQPPRQRVPVLRLKKRQAPPSLSDIEAAANKSSSSWTAMVVNNLKSKLPSWLTPSASASATNSSPSISPVTAPAINNLATQQPRKTNTSRRSTHVASMPMVFTNNNPTTAISAAVASDVKLNNLSEQIEVGSSNGTTTLINGNNLTTNNVELFEMNSGRLVLLLRVCVNYMSPRPESEMAIIEVGILSGFKPNEADLREIRQEPGTPVMKYELSLDHSLVIFYMENIPSYKQFCLQFRLIRDSLVYNLQSGYIRVYEYYSPTISCSSFYTPTRWTDLIETKCDSSGQICKCASKSMCPATRKLMDLSEIHSLNVTRAREQLVDLVCSNRYDFVSVVSLKGVKHLEAGGMFKLSLKVKYDLNGNLTKLMKAQRQQRLQTPQHIRKPSTPAIISVDHNGVAAAASGGGSDDSAAEDAGLNFLSAYIDTSCVKNELLLMHLAYPNQWKTGVQGGNEFILFGRYKNLEKRFFELTPKGPKPKANILSSKQQQDLEVNIFDQDAQQQQYSLTTQLDKDSILHDLTYQIESDQRKPINNLVRWLERSARLEDWKCPSTN